MGFDRPNRFDSCPHSPRGRVRWQASQFDSVTANAPVRALAGMVPVATLIRTASPMMAPAREVMRARLALA